MRMKKFGYIVFAFTLLPVWGNSQSLTDSIFIMPDSVRPFTLENFYLLITKMVLISVAITLPVGYFLYKEWLDKFAYRISLEWWYFIVAGLVALFITWLTVGSQTIRAARMNPTKSLRSE